MPEQSLGDVTLHYEEQGTGECLLLIGGTAVGCAYWRKYQLPAYSQRFRTISVDLRGAGQSEKPDEPYSTQQFAVDLFGLLDALGIAELNVLGHSMGASIAQAMAIQQPERIHRLVLASSGGHFDPRRMSTRGIPVKLAVELVEKGYERRMREHYGGVFTWPADFAAARPEVVQEMVDTVIAELPPLKNYLRHVIARQEHDLGGQLSAIRCPVLVLVGSEETLLEGTMPHLEAARLLAGRLPNATLVELPGAGHSYFWQMPERVDQLVLEFLATPIPVPI